MQKKIRRVVTGHNAEGKSIFIMDGPSPHVFNRGTGSVVVTDLWETHGTPADNRGNEDSKWPFPLTTAEERQRAAHHRISARQATRSSACA